MQIKQSLDGAAERSDRLLSSKLRSSSGSADPLSFPGVTSVGLVGVSGDGAVAAAGPAAALLVLIRQLEPLTRVVVFPQPRSLEDLLHQLLKGTLDAVFGLCTGL